VPFSVPKFGANQLIPNDDPDPTRCAIAPRSRRRSVSAENGTGDMKNARRISPRTSAIIAKYLPQNG
jgi:hypothetical protein